MTATRQPIARQRQAAWRDLRLWAGLALILVSTLAGSLVLGRSDAAVEVWSATADLAPGAPVQGRPVRVSLDARTAAAYLPASVALRGRVVAPIAAGALIPASAIASGDGSRGRLVTVLVDGGHAPLGIAAGDRVDVWSSPVPDPTGPSVAPPRLVLASALVHAVQGDELGVGGDLPVAIEVDADEVDELVAAARGSVIDLVAVPFDDPS